TSPRTTLPEAIIVGFQNKTLPILLRGTVKVVAARLFAWGALALLQDDTGSLADTLVQRPGMVPLRLPARRPHAHLRSFLELPHLRRQEEVHLVQRLYGGSGSVRSTGPPPRPKLFVSAVLDRSFSETGSSCGSYWRCRFVPWCR